MIAEKFNWHLILLVVATTLAMPIELKAKSVNSNNASPEHDKDEEFRLFAEDCYSTFKSVVGENAVVTDNNKRIIGPKHYEMSISYTVDSFDENNPLGPFQFKCVKEPGEETVIYFGNLD
jgi:hypothetical protein